MQRIVHTFIVFVLLSCSFSTQAQTTSAEPQQFLVQLSPDASIKTLVYQLEEQHSDLQWETPKQLIPGRNIWQLTYQGKDVDASLLRFLKQAKQVQIAQYNHRLSLRKPQATTPNDNLFANQWQYINNGMNGGTVNADIDADLAWDLATGGLTAQNDTIVVAVIDDGVNASHPDLVNNMWVNHAEIPNNGIDDDNNGYVDDYQGWNSNSNNDNIAGGNHGTPVAGIIGAEGNNGIGVAGVNWKVKLMVINNNFNTTEANVLIAYGYALTQRIRYNQTNGAEGAFVVVTNASWGMDYGTPADAPLWCAFYDTLGQHGILNIGATANIDIDVDVRGDLPTTCPSDYVLGITNINRTGNKQTAAGYGNQSIDLGAFGTGVYTLSAGSYNSFGGTSGAAPQVAGAVALLYAAACNNFIQYAKVRPDQAALAMRRYILDGVKTVPSLTNITATGGYLNLHNSLLECINDCPTNTCFEPYLIQTSNVTDQQALVSWQTVTAVNQVQYRFRAQGDPWPAFAPLPAGQDSVLLTGLLACTPYEVQLTGTCSGATSDTSFFNFRTDGCCEAPAYILKRTLGLMDAQVSWGNVFAVNTYLVSYKETSSSIWQTTSTTDTTILLTGLDSCVFYNVFVRGICNNGDTTTATSILSFSTEGCTGCANTNYCVAQGLNSSDDWIDTFQVDNYTNPSGNNMGYALFSNVQIFLRRGTYHQIYIRQGRSFPQGLRIWLDLNQDGDFDDQDEQIWEGAIPLNNSMVRDSIIIPSSAQLGVTRMRVAIRWRTPPSSCGDISYGEVEDYCVDIEPRTFIKRLPTDLEEVVVAPNPFGQTFQISLQVKVSSRVQGDLYNVTGQLVASKTWEGLGVGNQQLSWAPKVSQGLYLLRLTTENGQVTKRIVKY
ncbi:MAG: S8 family serine peptidase [Aureispira sp.]